MLVVLVLWCSMSVKFGLDDLHRRCCEGEGFIPLCRTAKSSTSFV
jgi:hypothetical protein